MRSVLLGLVATTCAGLLAQPVAAAAPRRSHTVTGSEADPAGVQPDGASCSASAGGCRLDFVGHATFSGGLRGTSAYELHFDPVPQPDGIHYRGTERFDSLTTPCGTGGVVVDLQGVYETTTIDVATHTTTLVERGQFRDGTGQLAGMTGSFTYTAHDHNDTTTDGSYRGAVTCDR